MLLLKDKTNLKQKQDYNQENKTRKTGHNK